MEAFNQFTPISKGLFLFLVRWFPPRLSCLPDHINMFPLLCADIAMNVNIMEPLIAITVIN